MGQNVYSDPEHNLNCSRRFTCGAAECPEMVAAKNPPCHVEKFRRYQPENEPIWYYRSWEEVNRITWREVFSLQESWIFTLLTIVIVVFLFMAMVLIYVLLKAKRYY